MIVRKHVRYLFACSLCMILFACHKSDSKPGNPTTSLTLGTMNINLTYGAFGIQSELIISEPGGKVLLDTLAIGGQPVIATLKTNDTLVDITTVSPLGGAYNNIAVYKSINASTIAAVGAGGYEIAFGLKTQATTPASIFYRNIPPGTLNNTPGQQFLFTNFPYNEFTN